VFSHVVVVLVAQLVFRNLCRHIPRRRANAFSLELSFRNLGPRITLQRPGGCDGLTIRRSVLRCRRLELLIRRARTPDSAPGRAASPADRVSVIARGVAAALLVSCDEALRLGGHELLDAFEFILWAVVGEQEGVDLVGTEARTVQWHVAGDGVVVVEEKAAGRFALLDLDGVVAAEVVAIIEEEVVDVSGSDDGERVVHVAGG
jgi:hypothetical protein